MDLTTTITARIRAACSKTVGTVDLAGTIDHNVTINLADWTGAGQADRAIELSGTLTFGTSVEIDLYGALTDLFGDALNAARIKGIIVQNTSAGLTPATTAVLNVQGGTHPWAGPFLAAGDGFVVPATGVALFARSDATGWVVTANTADDLLITNPDGAASAGYRVTIIAVQA